MLGEEQCLQIPHFSKRETFLLNAKLAGLVDFLFILKRSEKVRKLLLMSNITSNKKITNA